MSRASSLAVVAVLVAGVFATLVVPAPPAAAAGQLTTFLTGLNWPIALAFAPDGRVFYAERNTGNIRIVEGGSLLPTPYYTLTDTALGGERGFLGLAIDPGFPLSPWVYAYQTYDDAANGTIYNRVVRIFGAGNVGTSHEEVLRLPPVSFTNHNGGVIAFGPDGMLYVVVGENAIIALAQNLASPMGKVLRMNPDGSPPADNPFYGSLTADNLIYTYGHRNMFGLAFHPITGRVFVTENGPGCNDEINVLRSGANFGWGTSQTCATPPIPPNNTNQDGPSPILPIDWYTPTTAPTNAAIVSGPGFPTWSGDLVFGEWNTARLRRLDLAAPGYDTVLGRQTIFTAPSGILDVEMGPDGAIWFTTSTTIYRYVDTGQPPVASFTATPNPANVSEVVTFDGSASSDPDGTIVSYLWDFGDGANATGPTASHAYTGVGTYDVVLTVTDNESFEDTATTQLQVVGPNLPPVASFTATPDSTFVNIPVQFDASASSDPDGTIVSYSWDFGDSSFGTGVTIQHSYSEKRTFTVSLRVLDDEAGTDNATATVTIGNRGPQILSATPSDATVSIFVGQTADLRIVATDPDGDAVFYAWRVEANPLPIAGSSHAFRPETPGTYVVNVTVSDGELSDSHAWVVVVSPAPVTPTLVLAAVVLLASLFAAVILVVLARSRRRREPEGPPPPREP